MSALVDLAEAVLAAVVNYWPAPNPAAHVLALPERNYVYTGTPPYDCEQTVVWVERTYGTESSVAREAIVPLTGGIGLLRAMVLTVEIIRCVTVVDENVGEVVVPAATVMQAEALTALTDADLVLTLLAAAHGRGELAGCGGVAFENWRAITAQGGLAGGATKLRLNLF